MKVAVLGSGAWGTALALVLQQNGHQVALWSYLPEETKRLSEHRENPMLPGVSIPEGIAFTSDISCAEGCRAVIMATPSFAVRETAAKLAPHLAPGTVIVSVSKGIEKERLLRLSQVIEEEVGKDCPVTVLVGPSHAEEVSRGQPTGCVAACEKQEVAEWVQDLFMNERFRVYASPDVIGVELSAALKNIIALCAGVCDGLGLGDNTKAMLMTRGLTEIARLGVALGGRKETFAGLAGVGDLIVTCTSMHSRNRRAGILLGRGKTPEEAIREIGAVVEGYYACAAAWSLSQKLGVEMPITQACYEVLYQGKDAQDALHELMSREKKHEIEESWV